MAEEQQLKGTEDEEIVGVTSQDPNDNATSDADTVEEWKRQSITYSGAKLVFA